MPRPPDALHPVLALAVILMAFVFLILVAGCTAAKSTKVLSVGRMVKAYPVRYFRESGRLHELTAFTSPGAACFEHRVGGARLGLVCSTRAGYRCEVAGEAQPAEV